MLGNNANMMSSTKPEVCNLLQHGRWTEKSTDPQPLTTCVEKLMKFAHLVFTARCYASAVLAMGLCPSVSVSVCLSQAGVLLKRQNIESHKQHHTIPQGL